MVTCIRCMIWFLVTVTRGLFLTGYYRAVHAHTLVHLSCTTSPTPFSTWFGLHVFGCAHRSRLLLPFSRTAFATTSPLVRMGHLHTVRLPPRVPFTVARLHATRFIYLPRSLVTSSTVTHGSVTVCCLGCYTGSDRLFCYTVYGWLPLRY